MSHSVMDRRVDAARKIVDLAKERDEAIAERDAARKEAARYRKLHRLATRALGWAGAAWILTGAILSGALLLLRGRCA